MFNHAHVALAIIVTILVAVIVIAAIDTYKEVQYRNMLDRAILAEMKEKELEESAH